MHNDLCDGVGKAEGQGTRDYMEELAHLSVLGGSVQIGHQREAPALPHVLPLGTLGEIPGEGALDAATETCGTVLVQR